MQDMRLICGRLSEISEYNEKLRNFAQTGYIPVQMSKVDMGPMGYDICVLLTKR